LSEELDTGKEQAGVFGKGDSMGREKVYYSSLVRHYPGKKKGSPSRTSCFPGQRLPQLARYTGESQRKPNPLRFNIIQLTRKPERKNPHVRRTTGLPVSWYYIKFGRRLEAVENQRRLESFSARLAQSQSQWFGPPNPSAGESMEILQSPFRLPTMERGTAEKQVKSLYFEGVLPAFFITPPAWNSVPLKKYLSMVKSQAPGFCGIRH